MELLWLHLWTGTNSQYEGRSDCEWGFAQAGERHDGVTDATDPVSTFAVNAGAGGAVAGAMLVWRVAMSSCSVWSQQTRPSAGVQSSTRKRERSVRQVDWRVLSAHRWVRQRASHNRRTPQVTDHGLLSEHHMMLHVAMKMEKMQ